MMAAPMDAQEITGELMEENMHQEAQETQDLAASIREGLGMLFEDGWTAEELSMLSQDEGVRADIAAGLDVIRAAAKMLRRQMAQMQAARRRNLPVARTSASGSMQEGSPIDAMSDAQFDAFSRRAREAAMMGRKVRM